MKVAMLGWEFPPFVAGGLGVHCLELTRGLARQGVDVDFYMPQTAGVDVAAQHAHLRIHEVPAHPTVGPYSGTTHGYQRDFNAAVYAYNERVVEAFRSHDADVLHCHDWITIPAALKLRASTGIPLVLTMHSLEHDRSGGFYPQTWIEEIERQGVQQADKVIAVSRYTKQLLERLYGADPERVVAVDNGIDPERFADSRRDYAVGRGSVLFLARLSRQKAPLQFLKTARRVLEVRPEATFVVAGKGELLPECIDYTIEHGIADRVRFAGYVPDEDLGDFYRQHEVYVLPSVSEPFGISVLEAMAAGVPTIVTKTSGVGGSVSHALKADFWDVDEMADMIIRLLDSPELREEMGRQGSQEVHRFSWDVSAKKTIEAYCSV